MASFTIEHVIYGDSRHAADMATLLNTFARESIGKNLSQHVLQDLAQKLDSLSNALSILCYRDKSPVALANCFFTFSTFACAPVMNIHDLIVDENFRGQGLSQMLLREIETVALQRKCCKITLEVVKDNQIAQNAYKKFGFCRHDRPDKIYFWEKTIYNP